MVGSWVGNGHVTSPTGSDRRGAGGAGWRWSAWRAGGWRGIGRGALVVARPLTATNSFTSGIEGPACDRDGNVYAVNFERQQTIGRVAPSGQASVFMVLPNRSIGNGIRFDRDGIMYVADYVAHNVLRVESVTRQISVLAHHEGMTDARRLANKRLVRRFEDFGFDGMRCDGRSSLYHAARQGHCGEDDATGRGAAGDQCAGAASEQSLFRGEGWPDGLRDGGEARAMGPVPRRPAGVGMGALETGSSVGDERPNVLAGKAFSAAEESQLNHEGDFEEVTSKTVDQADRGGSGPAGGEDVVDEEDPLTGANGVNVQGQGVGTVLEAVALLEGLERELSLFADGHDARPEPEGDGGSEEETTGVDAGDHVDLAGLPGSDEEIDASGEEAWIREEGGDVLELDARLGEVGDVADGGVEFGDGDRIHCGPIG